MSRHSVLTEAGVIAIVGSAFANWLPAISAVVGVIYWGIGIWETQTVQGLIKRWRGK